MGPKLLAISAAAEKEKTLTDLIFAYSCAPFQ